MGCAQTRDKSIENEIQLAEESLQFGKHTIPELNQAFFHTNGSNVVNAAQLERVLEELEIKLTLESEFHYKNFISAFVSFEEEGENFYDLTELLIAIYLLSKSSLREKASALFDLYNDEAKDELSRMEIERILDRIAEVVFTYSEKLMDTDEGLSQMHCKLSATKKEEVLPKIYAFFFADKENLDKEYFIRLVDQAAKKEDLIDFTSSSSIRKVIMDFVLQPKKTQVELQQHYDIGRLKRHETAFEDDVDAWTSVGSPTAAARRSVGIHNTPKANAKGFQFHWISSLVIQEHGTL